MIARIRLAVAGLGCLTALYFFLAGCNGMCTLDPEPFGYVVRFDLLNKSTGRTLIASRDSSYVPDSIFIENPRASQQIRMVVYSRDTIVNSDYIHPGSLFMDTLYFKYRNTKIDTIVVFSHEEKRKICGERLSFVYTDRLIVNGTTICNPCNNYLDKITLRR